MRVPTANIIIGFNKEVMDRLFTAGATYKNLIQGLTVSGVEGDALLFDSQSNPNFISFTHTFGMSKGSIMELTLIDPKGELEKRFASDNIISNIAGFAYNDDEYASQSGDGPPEATGQLLKKILKDMENSRSLYDNQFFHEFKTKYQKTIANKIIYVAYGSGNNLDLWSGPHRVNIVNATIDLKGARKISLVLQPTPDPIQTSQRRGAYNEEVDLDLAGMTMRVTGESKEIKFLNSLEQKPAYDPMEYLGNKLPNTFGNKQDMEIKSSLHKLDLGSYVSQLEAFDFHSIVVDALRSYIQNATSNNNVIVLLPNLNIICRNYINNTYKLTNCSDSTLGKRMEFMTPIADFGNKENLILEFLNGLGLDLIIEPPNKDKIIPPVSVDFRKDSKKAASPKERYEQRYKDNNFIAILANANDRGIPKHNEAITYVIDRILEHSKEDYQIQYTVFNETDTKVLDYWSNSDLNKYPTFGGYNTFKTNKEAIIVGDQNLIRSYLYGKKSAKKAQEKASKLKLEAAGFKGLEKANKILGAKGIIKFDTSGLETGLNQASKDKHIDSLLALPIHPLDSILLDEDYQRGIREVTIFPHKGSAGFGNISDIPDEFSYEEELKDAYTTFIEEEGISVFRFNTSNPNVTDIKSKFGPIYLQQILNGFQKVVSNRAALVTEGVLPVGIGSFPVRTQGAALAYAHKNDLATSQGDEERQEAANAIAGRLSLDLQKEITDINPGDVADFVDSMLQEIEKGNSSGGGKVIEVGQFVDGNPQSLLNDMAVQMYQKALMLEITTLPSFHLSNTWDIQSPCLLFAQDNNISQTHKPDRTLMNKFFSGQYKILGFTHTISPSKSESRFSLAKTIINTSTKEEEDNDDE
tara:strand:- start:794 stop:3391 length:2598 start_codon:yes stop_codon:yes gene_type:complete